MAKKTFLDFEQPVAELEAKIEELRYVQTESAVDITLEIDQLSKKSQQLTKDIYSDLTPWQITKIARHPERPYTLDYINGIFKQGDDIARFHFPLCVLIHKYRLPCNRATRDHRTELRQCKWTI